MRLFNIEVYKQTQYGTTATYTPPSFNAILGSAEKMACHVRVTRASGTTPKITIKQQVSNDGQDWVDRTPAFVNQTTLSTSAETTMMAIDSGSTPNAGLMRLSVELSGSDNIADIRITVCGRGEQIGT